MSTLKNLKLAASAGALVLTAVAADAQQTNLRIQTHYSQETLSGQMAATFIEAANYEYKPGSHPIVGHQAGT